MGRLLSSRSELDYVNAHMRTRRQRRAVRTWLRGLRWLRLPDLMP
jgi:hypothetical protein